MVAKIPPHLSAWPHLVVHIDVCINENSTRQGYLHTTSTDLYMHTQTQERKCAESSQHSSILDYKLEKGHPQLSYLYPGWKAEWEKIFVFKWQLFFWRINKQDLKRQKEVKTHASNFKIHRSKYFEQKGERNTCGSRFGSTRDWFWPFRALLNLPEPSDFLPK